MKPRLYPDSVEEVSERSAATRPNGVEEVDSRLPEISLVSKRKLEFIGVEELDSIDIDS